MTSAMRVVGSGFGRTGTTPMKAALELLGLGPCYHMQEVFKRPSHARAWGAWRPGGTPDIDGRFEDRDHAIDVCERWTRQVIATVPTDRLLLFDVAEGWPPLCELLDVPVPDQPFPRINDRDVFQRRLRAIQIASRAVPAAAGIGLATGVRRISSARPPAP